MTVQFKNFEIRRESIRVIQDRLRELHAKHYAETETRYLSHSMDPDYVRFGQLESEGHFVLYTARDIDTGQLVGDLMYFIGKSLHGNYTTATEDAFFLVPECRGSGLARQMLRYAEADLLLRGVDYAFQSSKQPVGGPNIGPLLETEGYREIARVFFKKLGA